MLFLCKSGPVIIMITWAKKEDERKQNLQFVAAKWKGEKRQVIWIS